MSFYVYYGQLKNQLLVTVLPNGTVEHGDPIYLYSERKFSSYTAKSVSSTDGEDRVTFNDGYYSYEVASKKAYKELSLIVKGGDGSTSKVALTRHYDQPLTAIPLSDQPKIWTGAIDFHKWAKNESFIAIAPQGLGNGKAVVCLWQWTEDAKGVPRTLSYSTGKQDSQAASPTTFSFKQGDYYTLNCKVNAATKGLNVTIKSPTNPEVVQKELVLSAKLELGADHSFAPPRPAQQKITLDCSLPRAAPSLARITGALPFPADLVETLTYSAAYVDQAGYLAKYAVKQFDELDKSYHQLEEKFKARAAKVATLEGDVGRLGAANAVLTGQNMELTKQLESSRQAAAESQASLQKRVDEALKALVASQGREKELKDYIHEDKLADIERERKHHEHDAADHKAIDLANKALGESREAEQELRETLQVKEMAFAKLEASLKHSAEQLDDAEATIRRLKAELDVEKTQRGEIQKKLEQEEIQKTEIKKRLDQETYLLSTTKRDLGEAQDKIKAKDRTIKDNEDKIKSQKITIKETEDAHTQAKTQRDIEEQKVEDLKNEQEKIIAKYESELKKQREHDDEHHLTMAKSTVTTSAKEIVA